MAFCVIIPPTDKEGDSVAIKNNDQGGRRENHKYKALLVAQVLLKRTDEDHAIRTSEIIDYLKEYGITAEARRPRVESPVSHQQKSTY